MTVETIFQIAILIFSVIVHEVSHGVAAYALGDMTAKRAGRLTLNPLPHIDPMGSIILPGLMVLTHSPILFGWAKPVPYNPYNFQKGGRYGEALVAFAGPGSNFALALIFGLVIRFGFVPEAALTLAFVAVYTNILLGIFNLIPIPPLDGSKVLAGILPRSLHVRYAALTRSLQVNPLLGFGLVVALVFIFGSAFGSLIFTLARLIAGV